MEQIIIFDGNTMMKELSKKLEKSEHRSPDNDEGNILAVQRANEWLATMKGKVEILNRQVGISGEQIVITIWYRVFAM